MKKVFILLIVFILGMNKYLVADDHAIISGEEKAVVSDDKSKISLVRTNIMITVDTIRDYLVDSRARYYLKDKKIVEQLISTGIANPSDSLLPKNTHIFRKDTWIKRQLSINSNGIVVYGTIGGYQAKPTYLLEFCLSLIISVLFLLLGYVNRKNRNALIWGSIFLTIFIFLGYLETRMTWPDLIVCLGIQLLPAILLIIFNCFDKIKDHISKHNILVRSHIISKPFGPIKRK